MATQYDTLARLSKRHRTICISPQSFDVIRVMPTVMCVAQKLQIGARQRVQSIVHVVPRASNLHAHDGVRRRAAVVYGRPSS